METGLKPGYAGLLDLGDRLGAPLEPYQHRIARAFFGGARVIAALLPRGNFKTSLAAMLGIHELLTGENPSITIGAASQNQARICFERMVGFIQGSDMTGSWSSGHSVPTRSDSARMRSGPEAAGTPD